MKASEARQPGIAGVIYLTAELAGAEAAAAIRQAYPTMPGEVVETFASAVTWDRITVHPDRDVFVVTLGMPDGESRVIEWDETWAHGPAGEAT